MAALAFGAVLEHAGMLERILAPAVGFARSTVALVATVVATAIGMNIVAGDQYIAIVLPGRMFKSRVRAARLGASAPVAHDRRLRHGDLAAGAVEQLRRLYVGDARVFAFAYLPYAFFNLLNPLTTILAAFLLGRTMAASPAPAAQSEI